MKGDFHYAPSSTSTPTTDLVPNFISQEELVMVLHGAAAEGERKKVKKLLKKGTIYINGLKNKHLLVCNLND